MARLSVNLNKVALLRNSRRTGVPDIARFALASGAALDQALIVAAMELTIAVTELSLALKERAGGAASSPPSGSPGKRKRGRPAMSPGEGRKGE
jgi:hypothetical protein